MAIDLHAADTRVFLFHSPNAATDPGGALDSVNQWLSKDRSGGPYSNLRVRDITVTSDGMGGVYTTIVCSLGQHESLSQTVSDILEPNE
jgi:hypothetical protein